MFQLLKIYLLMFMNKVIVPSEMYTFFFRSFSFALLNSA